ncbi:unnamed protein product [Protopolystoma xenopodis]|uniref:Uncharacterized protein n=1 Tax=Protopolystoma xenopodis TaxID=117903 RepID=A0A3S5CDR3_9PLAT|nr:unnamed protein product [Protopolystoma xenopodis]
MSFFRLTLHTNYYFRLYPLSNRSPISGPTPSSMHSHWLLGWLADPRDAHDIAALEEVSTACLAALPTAEEVLNKGSELARAFNSVGVNFPAGGPGSSDSGVGDSAENAVERVHRLMEELSEAVNSVDELNERIAGELEWRRLQQQSKQVFLVLIIYLFY